MKVLMSPQEWIEFPNCPKEFSNEIFSEDAAAMNHGQTLYRLNERGGMHPLEMVLNILNMRYRANIATNLTTGRCITVLIAVEYAYKNEDKFFKEYFKEI